MFKKFKRGEKGFTLIELLIVIAILGVLAAIVVPNVGRFIGSGTQQAMDTEQKTVQSAVQQMMISEGLNTLDSANVTAVDAAHAINDMAMFPSDDYPLWTGDMTTNYLAENTTSYWYYIQNGTVQVVETDPNG